MTDFRSKLRFHIRVGMIGACALALAACGSEADNAPEPILAVGSSTVFPFAKKVAEDYVAANEGSSMPVINSTGTSGGIAEFCAGEGPATADIANASRRMTQAEFETCTNNGVTGIIEVKVGRDGVVFVSAVEDGIEVDLTPAIVYRALSANPLGEEQTAVNWSDVDRSLPDETILVYGPPSTSGTRDALLDLIMTPACRANPAMATLEESDPAEFERDCHELRDDQAYLDQGEQDGMTARKVANEPRAIGIFGYAYLEENPDIIKGLPLGGVSPTAEAIADGSYPGSRGLYIYVKEAHLDVTPGLRDYLTQWSQSWSAGGPLAAIGLVPMTEEAQATSAATIANPSVITAGDLE
ncbi:MAG: substrate-binding domain-containing protein [Pseudomonadota bacterium]